MSGILRKLSNARDRMSEAMDRPSAGGDQVSSGCISLMCSCYLKARMGKMVLYWTPFREICT